MVAVWKVWQGFVRRMTGWWMLIQHKTGQGVESWRIGTHDSQILVEMPSLISPLPLLFCLAPPYLLR